MTKSACYAPHSALYFRPDGLVHACCVTGFSIGTVVGPDRESLRQIWQGTALAAQRQVLEADAFDLGCQECEFVAESGGREATVAYHFDRFSEGSPHRFPKMLDLALSSRCNLQCVMCNGGLSSAIRTQREGLPPLPDCYDDQFFEELDEFLPHLERLQFKGGEPFLARENQRIWDRLIELGLTPEVTVTTNGTLFNDRVAHYVRELRMHPNISVDGMAAETIEAIRVGVDAERLWHNIDRFQELAEQAGNGMTLSFCLMPMNWREVLPFLAEADRRQLNCNVIFVNQPQQYDILRLPREELAEILAELSSVELELVGDAPRNSHAEVLERIRSHLENPVDLVESSVLMASRPIHREAQAELRAMLVGEFACEPMLVEAEDGIVCSVEVPDWAEWLGASEFVGGQLDLLDKLIEKRCGPVTNKWLVSPMRGVVVLAIQVATEGGLRELRVYRLVDADSGRQRVYVVDAAPAGNTASTRS